MEALKALKEKILGTEAQNKKAAEEMKNDPMEKKFQKMMGNELKEEKQVPVKKMAKGGTASSRADGCAVKGKTRGRMV